MEDAMESDYSNGNDNSDDDGNDKYHNEDDELFDFDD
jgi:hypothetical protein